MKRALVIVVAVAAVAITALVAIRSRPGEARDLRPEDAAAALRTEPGFTTREHSPVGRELMQILAVRRIGRSSCEVEFTWKDTVPPVGQRTASLRTSMGLFRLQEDGRWRLTSLFRVD